MASMYWPSNTVSFGLPCNEFVYRTTLVYANCFYVGSSCSGGVPQFCIWVKKPAWTLRQPFLDHNYPVSCLLLELFVERKTWATARKEKRVPVMWISGSLMVGMENHEARFGEIDV